LDAAQRFGRCCIATEDYEGAAHVKKPPDCLKGEFVNNLETACSIGSTSVVSQIYVVILGH
jgi:hypothetical protein